MATTLNITNVIRAAVAQISAANTNRDGTGTLVDVFTAGTSGSRIEHIDIKAIVTTTVGMVRLYLYDGTNTRLWQEVVVTAITVGGGVAGFSSSVNCSFPSLVCLLPSGWKLKASTHNAETFNVTAFGGDF